MEQCTNTPPPSVPADHPVAEEPFPRRRVRDSGFQPTPGVDKGPVAPLGIERRIVRRAEAVWQGLLGGQQLPPAAAAKILLKPPFSTGAMLLVDRRITYVGEGLLGLGVELSPSIRRAGSLAARLTELGISAIHNKCPMLFDTDNYPDEEQLAGLLARAIALPLAPSPAGAHSAVIVASWRRLLPDDKADVLQREFSAAMKQ